MEIHTANDCENKTVICETCEENTYPNKQEGGPHDCIQTLKKNLKAAREEIKSQKNNQNSQNRRIQPNPDAPRPAVERQLLGGDSENEEDDDQNLNYNSYSNEELLSAVQYARNESNQPRDSSLCPNGHQLVQHSGEVGEYNGFPMCDNCGIQEINLHESFQRCAACKYDRCNHCDLASGLDAADELARISQ